MIIKELNLIKKVSSSAVFACSIFGIGFQAQASGHRGDVRVQDLLLVRTEHITVITYCRDIMLSVGQGRNNIALFNHPAFKSIAKGQKKATVKLIQAPKIGAIHLFPDFVKPNDSYVPLTQQAREVLIDRSSWHDDTNAQQISKDRAVFEIEAGSKKYRLTVNFWIAGIAEENIDNHTECKKLKMHLSDKKISGSTNNAV